jgi:uncharacterized protein with PIN domain
MRCFGAPRSRLRHWTRSRPRSRATGFVGSKGRHPAGLNLGDCFAYALARREDEPLLFVGDDFDRTDLASALPC